ncbi:GAF domain-containing protein [Sulfitobacter sp. TSTF-M16]|uniref:GAF domain-containing protein n=1 Tax=Sulfitobacter aestuariivivens TaxID=2766981 RepID=A0A927D3C2_9RHOB|nr:adenylate/guanylate cyclase domain-containing protein [Sulfitobacter aestuariivivens]MBD3664380.1 GAF domain-containing protein [Sulfitobacter aestuariivivens]
MSHPLNPTGPHDNQAEPEDGPSVLTHLKARLAEALDRQSATAEILDVISSSPRDARPVFDAIVHAGQKLFPRSTISIGLREGDNLILGSISGPEPAGVEAWRRRFPAPLHPETIHGHVILEGKALDLPDVAAVQDRFRIGAGNFLASGFRAVTMTPISQGGQTVGALSVLRHSTGSLDKEQFEILNTFAAQANIALDNLHLLNQMRDANETLENVSRQLAKYMPPQLYDSIIEGDRQAAIASRRRKLTVFFSDIVDFSEITDQLEAEELTHLLNTYLSEMSRIAQKHGAYFDKFIGDAMMLYFGEPDSRGAQEDAAACVRMAIEMQRRLDALQKSWQGKGLIDRPFRSRIGINTGYCTVGNFGSEERMDYTAIGREVNLAARLEAECDPGGILLSAETYSLVGEWLSVEERAPVEMKGFKHPIRTFAATAIYAGDTASRSILHKDGTGFSVTVDLERMTSSARLRAVRYLQSVISELNK